MERLGEYISRHPELLESWVTPTAKEDSMTVAPEAETEVVSGVIQGIVAKGGDKYQVEVNVGQQNPRRLWTKDVTLVNQLSTMIGHQTSFLCGISHWTNQSGQAVRSLWINGVGQGATVPPPMPVASVPSQPTTPPLAAPLSPAPILPPAQANFPQPTPTVTMGPTPLEKEDRIMREAASKVAAILLSHLPSEQRTFDSLLTISEQLVSYYKHGLYQEASDPYSGDPGPMAPPHGDGFPEGY